MSDPVAIGRALDIRITQLQAEETDAEIECKRFEHELDELAMERQKVITWARKGTITDSDLDTQLLAVDWQENALRRELEEKRLLTGNKAERLANVARSYSDFVRKGWDEINAQADTPEQAERQLKFKKTIVQAIVTKVIVHADRTIGIEAELGLSEESAKMWNVDPTVYLRYNAKKSGYRNWHGDE